MVRTMLVGLAAICFTLSLAAQEEARFTAQVDKETVLMGHYVEVKFTLEGAPSGHFSAPDLSDFHVLSGPNQSSVMQIVNGTVSQSTTYTYYLEPKDIGNYYIPPATVDLGDRILETQPIDLVVVPNPENIPQESPHSQPTRPDLFAPWGEQMPGLDLDQLEELWRQMLPGIEGEEGFRFFQDSIQGMPLEELFRMLPDLQLDWPGLMPPPDPAEKPKKKRKIYKI